MSQAVLRSKLWIALIVGAAAMSLGLLGPTLAQAGVGNFCNPTTLTGFQWCQGPGQVLTQVYGWGDQHSVCVKINGGEKRCSGGPGAGVYSPAYPPLYAFPLIQNNAAGNNTVHGVVFTP
jgi:hypothetical protein